MTSTPGHRPREDNMKRTYHYQIRRRSDHRVEACILAHDPIQALIRYATEILGYAEATSDTVGHVYTDARPFNPFARKAIP